MSRTPQEIFQSYVLAGPLSRDADALAENFTPDGVLEMPLLPDGAAFPRRLVGREAIRSAMAAYYERQGEDGRRPNLEKSGYVLHTTADPAVFIAEIDTVFDADGDAGAEGANGANGADDGGAAEGTTVSLVQIFRVRDGRIALLRDYFAPGLLD
ncbi:nuclear transport factor 2 family protein [Kitasatospora sp. NPDC054939]